MSSDQAVTNRSERETSPGSLPHSGASRAFGLRPPGSGRTGAVPSAPEERESSTPPLGTFKKGNGQFSGRSPSLSLRRRDITGPLSPPEPRTGRRSRQAKGPCPDRPPGNPPPAHLAPAHEVSDVGPQGRASRTQALVGGGRRAAPGEAPQKALHGRGGGQCLSHPGSPGLQGQHSWAGGAWQPRPAQPFDQAPWETPPPRPGWPRPRFLLPALPPLLSEWKNTAPPAACLLVTGMLLCHGFLQSPEKPSFFLKWLVSCRCFWKH